MGARPRRAAAVFVAALAFAALAVVAGQSASGDELRVIDLRDQLAASPEAVADSVLQSPQRAGFVLGLSGEVLALYATTERLSGDQLSYAVEESAQGTDIRLGSDVFFAFDEARLTEEARAALDGLADLIQERAGEVVLVAGHTDNIGSAQYNQGLSEARAQAVRDHLVDELGLDQYDYDVVGFGDTQPIAPNETSDGQDNPAGRALNRRVEIRLEPPE